MANDLEFYSQRLNEELQLADAAQSAQLRQLHARRADDYACSLALGSVGGKPDAVSQWKLRRQAEVFGDWLADVM
jgi:hypothetical protein